MPPLKNINHEKFAHAILEKPTIGEAYLASYDPEGNRLKADTKKEVATANGSRLLRNDSVTNRISELLNRQGITIERLNGKLADLLEGKSEEIQFKSTRLGYELHGVLNPEKNIGESASPILIQVNISGSDGTNKAVSI